MLEIGFPPGQGRQPHRLHFRGMHGEGTPMKLAARRVVAALAAVPVVGYLAMFATPGASASGGPPLPSANARIGGPLMAGSGVVVNYPAHGAIPLPNVPASAYVIADANTGAVLAAKDPHGLFPPASTLKVLTAITLLPKLNPNMLVTATKMAASVEPNIVGLIPGHKYRVADLFRALLLISANDAAVSLAQATGSFAKGMAMINAEAHHLQAYDVVAKVPNGLPATGQVVSAYDLALIARQALAMPSFMKYDETLTASFPLAKHKQVGMLNQNYLLTQYRGGIGGKIGWTIKAEATYIGMARRHGVTLIATILHCTSLQEIYSAEKLLNWGFAMVSHVRPVGTLVAPLRLTSARPAHKPVTKPRGSANTSGSLAAGTTHTAQVAIGGAIAAVLCAGLVGFILLRRRAAAAKKSPT
jgi:D-alanyl-D-alanine carboxypeptidase (penicillin-binding protein 5/6)